MEQQGELESPRRAAAQETAAQQESPTSGDLSLPADASQVRIHLEVPEGACLQVEVEARAPSGRLLGRHALVFDSTAPSAPAVPVAPLVPPASLRVSSPRLPALAHAFIRDLPLWLTWIALGIYAVTRLVALPSFPIYFFTDEAIQTVSAADLLTYHFSSPTHEFLPTYFENGSQYNLSASVYLQVLPYLLFGKSIWVTRGVSALMTLLAAASLGLMFKNVFKSNYPWLAVMVLSITPAWFLHSRTAFETVLAATFYAVFLYTYMMCRAGHLSYLYAAVAAGALSFYSYSGMRMVLLVTCLLLALSDLRYHWQNRKTLLKALGLALLCALPFARFLVNHPDASGWQLRLLGSYWVMDIPLVEKLSYFVKEYLRGLDPLYWYLPNGVDLPRHQMLGYGHLLRQTLPLALLGIVLALRYIRVSAYRTLLIAMLAAPAGAALVRLGITRALVMVVPMAALTGLGTAGLMDWLRRRRLPGTPLALVVFAILAFANIFMLRNALVNGPLWFHDYGLTGMQYGAQQLFGEVQSYLDAHPGAKVVVSPSWANGTDVTARFFFSDPLPFEMGSAEGYYNTAQPLEDVLFVMIPEEYERIPRSRFSQVTVEKTLPYPDGRPGFYFVRFKYVPDIQDVIRREDEKRRLPMSAELAINGQAVKVSYTRLDMGEIKDIFSNNPAALIRTDAINPMELTFDFPAARSLQSITLRVGGAATTVQAQVWIEGQDRPVELSKQLPEAANLRSVTLELPAQVSTRRVWVSVKNTNDPPEGHVHLWSFEFH